MAPPTETPHIQFGSINQNSNISMSSTNISNKTGDIPVLKEVKFGSLPATDATLHRPQIRSQQQQQPKTEIPRSARTTNDARLFTQPYAPRRDFNQGDYPNNNNNSNNRYYNNRHNGNHKNGYVKPPAAPQQSNHYNSNSNNVNNTPIVSYQPYSTLQQPQHIQSQTTSTPTPTPPQQPTQQSPLLQPTTTSSSSYHRSSPKIQQSPQMQQQSPQQTSPSMHASPSMNYTKKNVSPSMPHSSPVTTSAWPPHPLYPYYSQYGVQVPSYNGIAPHSRGYVPPSHVKKPIAIVDPNTGVALDTTPMALSTVTVPTKTEKFEFKIPQPNVSKRVEIVDPATRDRELREKREREEAELEAKRKAEEERLEQERKAAEEKEREERERLEKERLEREEKERKDKEEAERLEKERLAAIEAEIQKKNEEEKARRKAEEEQELKRIKSELEAKKKKDEEERARSSALPTRSVQLIEDPSTVQYPSTVEPPSKVNGRFTYSVEFLKLFSTLCKDTTVDLTLLNDAVASTPDYQNPSANVIRERSGSHRGQNGGSSSFRMGSRDGRMEMGKFNTGRPLNPRNSNSNGMFMERQASSGGRGGRGGMGRQGSMKVIRNPSQQQTPLMSTSEPVAPLEKSENRWVPATILSQQTQTKPAETTENGLLSEEVIIRKVKALLNKLTVEKFDSISAQIFEYCKQSEKEEDGKALRTVIKLTFEKACDEPAFASMWARLCRRMSDSMTNDIRDTSLLDDKGNVSFGVLLFRRYLFNRCQKEFEKGWKVNMPEMEEGEMLTDEYYAAAKAKRQGLGLIQFIGELFKLEMLSERIMYHCLTKLCNDPTNAGDEEAESLCKLLSTIGKKLDSKPQTTRWIDVVIQRMKDEMINSAKMSSRMKFMIQDILDLRKQNWVPRNANNQVAPTTLAKIHEMAEKNKEQKEATAVKRGSSNRGPYIPNQYNNNMQRTGSYRGGRDHFHSNNNNTSGNNANNNNSADGWNTVGISSPVSDKPRVNELSNFGKTDRSRSKNNILGPSNSPFPSLTRNKTNTDNKNSGDGRSSPAVNMFSALSDGDKTEGRKRPGEGRSSPAVNMFNALSDGDESSKTSQPSPKMSSSDANKLPDEVIKQIRRC
ncbi:hypothetical protein RO3G_02645 [Rhizopus delemar RA 99-880]|uniref:MIF4G domain-containing protein n=1 Tax=Rhizopus delemar (strain RA 99-880 / ATCC MYA-4621 / FGSC 9543 / NRRL 43880) TaxID=246409 RepID=I1BP11_RHIO9|nr:hypothetical protein RO3G_02645 [Rhizopus delemar RA 99-880]|eukprot:EIE77941.1 hypothetical protein RO3G_02645 [Rhizopus delemar RA 99-880]